MPQRIVGPRNNGRVTSSRLSLVLSRARTAPSILATALALSLTAISCSSAAPPADPGKLIASKSINRDGGIMTFPGGSVIGSAGTVSEPTDVKIASYADPLPQNQYLQQIQPAVSVDMSGVTPTKPLRVELTIDSAKLPNGTPPAAVTVAASPPSAGNAKLIPATYDENTHSVSFSTGSLVQSGAKTLFYPILIQGGPLFDSFVSSVTQNSTLQRAATLNCINQSASLPNNQTVSFGQQPSLSVADPVFYDCLSAVPGDASAVELTIANNRPYSYAFTPPNGALTVPDPTAPAAAPSADPNAGQVAPPGVIRGTSITRLMIPVTSLPTNLQLYPDTKSFFANSVQSTLLEALPTIVGDGSGGSDTSSSLSDQLSALSQSPDSAQCLNSSSGAIIGSPPADLVSSTRAGIHIAIQCINTLVQPKATTEQRQELDSALQALSAQVDTYNGFDQLSKATWDTGAQTIEIITSGPPAAAVPAVPVPALPALPKPAAATSAKTTTTPTAKATTPKTTASTSRSCNGSSNNSSSNCGYCNGSSNRSSNNCGYCNGSSNRSSNSCGYPTTPTAVTLTPSVTSDVAGKLITLTAKVAPTTATGIIRFTGGTAHFIVAVINGNTAPISVTLQEGPNMFAAMFIPDSGYAPSQATVTVTGTPPPAPQLLQAQQQQAQPQQAQPQQAQPQQAQQQAELLRAQQQQAQQQAQLQRAQQLQAQRQAQLQAQRQAELLRAQQLQAQQQPQQPSGRSSGQGHH
jgi:hypothetical protein